MPPTIRTARSRSSGGHLFDVLPEMTPSFPRTGVSGHAGAVHAGRNSQDLWIGVFQAACCSPPC